MDAAPAVLEVTDVTVRMLSGGSGRRPPRALIEAALDWIDDPVGLFDERPVGVADMWRSLVVALIGPVCGSVVVVHPPGWGRPRIERVVAAANTIADHIEAVDADRWDRAGAATPESDDRGQPRRRGGRCRAYLFSVAVALMIGGAVWAWAGKAEDSAGWTVTEGRMAVRVPAHWHLQRVTAGPGSRRLQVNSPDDPAIAVHLTSSYAPEATLVDAAEAVARAIAGEPPGVFADLRARATVAGREAVTYREYRPGRVVDWIVVQAGSTRISIGCQSPPGRESDVRVACDEAVRSARQK